MALSREACGATLFGALPSVDELPPDTVRGVRRGEGLTQALGRAVKALALALTLCSAAAPAALSQQIAGGDIYGLVRAESDAVLRGVNVTLGGEAGTRGTVSGEQGAFRFLNLPRGTYTLTLSLTGFATVTRAVRVTTGEDVEVDFTMRASAIEETVVVLGETPLVTTQRRGTATTMTTEELHKVPNSRDPWGVLKAVPGITVDRVNIAGNENGQQAGYTGKGSSEKNWNLDGLVITDMDGPGASPDYYDFEAFEEINVTTGGQDLQVPSGGVGINLTTRRGTNTFHGGGRLLLSHRDLSFGNVPPSMAEDPRLENPDGTRRDRADHIQQISDYGFSLGGPIVKDRLWFYGGWGTQDIRLVRLIGTQDRTLLPAWNVKVNWQATSNTVVSAFWFMGGKQKFGRETGWDVQEEDSFLWNQDTAYEDKVGGPKRPPGLWKLQVDHTLSPNLFMSVNGAYFNTGFTLAPRGGLDQAFTVDYVRGVAIGSWYDYTAVRPQWHFNATGHYFFAGLGGQNELKFGFGYRDITATEVIRYGGNQLGGLIFSEEEKEAWVIRDGVVRLGGTYTTAWVGDVLTRDRFTFNLGVRWDLQRARNLPSEVPANASFPDLLPGLSYEGSGTLIDWNTWSPRLGMSWALDQSRKTVLRASYANYAEQLGFYAVVDENPVAWGVLGYGWADTNRDRFVQADEVQLDNFLYNFNIDPDDPAAVGSTVNKIDRNLEPMRDHELILAIDREIGPSFALGLAYTWRRGANYAYSPYLGSPCTGEPTVESCRIILPSEYTANDPSTANGYTAFTHSPDPDLVSAGSGGLMRTNAPDYRRTYNGLETTLVKRLSDGWMGRVAFSWNDWKESWDGAPYAASGYAGNPTPTQWAPLVEGGQVTFLGGKGSTSNIRWQLYANALVQLPWSLDASGALFARQGGPYPVSLLLPAGRDGTMPALATETAETLRYDSIFNLDLRLAKTITIRGRARLVLSAEWFNVFNSGTVLSRYMFANSPSFVAEDMGAIDGRGRIEEILSPSIFRVGARLAF